MTPSGTHGAQDGDRPEETPKEKTKTETHNGQDREGISPLLLPPIWQGSRTAHLSYSTIWWMLNTSRQSPGIWSMYLIQLRLFNMLQSLLRQPVPTPIVNSKTKLHVVWKWRSLPSTPLLLECSCSSPAKWKETGILLLPLTAFHCCPPRPGALLRCPFSVTARVTDEHSVEPVKNSIWRTGWQHPAREPSLVYLLQKSLIFILATAIFSHSITFINHLLFSIPVRIPPANVPTHVQRECPVLGLLHCLNKNARLLVKIKCLGMDCSILQNLANLSATWWWDLNRVQSQNKPVVHPPHRKGPIFRSDLNYFQKEANNVALIFKEACLFLLSQRQPFQVLVSGHPGPSNLGRGQEAARVQWLIINESAGLSTMIIWHFALLHVTDRILLWALVLLSSSLRLTLLSRLLKIPYEPRLWPHQQKHP